MKRYTFASLLIVALMATVTYFVPVPNQSGKSFLKDIQTDKSETYLASKVQPSRAWFVEAVQPIPSKSALEVAVGNL